MQESNKDERGYDLVTKGAAAAAAAIAIAVVCTVKSESPLSDLLLSVTPIAAK